MEPEAAADYCKNRISSIVWSYLSSVKHGVKFTLHSSAHYLGSGSQISTHVCSVSLESLNEQQSGKVVFLTGTRPVWN